MLLVFPRSRITLQKLYGNMDTKTCKGGPMSFQNKIKKKKFSLVLEDTGVKIDSFLLIFFPSIVLPQE
jgi:hypothetical protein